MDPPFGHMAILYHLLGAATAPLIGYRTGKNCLCAGGTDLMGPQVFYPGPVKPIRIDGVVTAMH